MRSDDKRRNIFIIIPLDVFLTSTMRLLERVELKFDEIVKVMIVNNNDSRDTHGGFS